MLPRLFAMRDWSTNGSPGQGTYAHGWLVVGAPPGQGTEPCAQGGSHSAIDQTIGAP